jgi:hypothetical protein
MDGIEVVRQEASAIMVWANGLAVRNADEYKLAFEKVKEIKAVRKRWTDYWSPLKTKAHATWKEIVGKEKEGTDICDNAELIAKRKADAWRQEEERKAAEEQRRLQAEADRQARRERERLEKEAAKLKTPELKQERLEQAAAVEAPVVAVEKPAVEGVSVRTTTKARLVDMNALIAAATPGSVAASFLEFNEKAANAFARSTKGSVKVAGIEFYEERTSSVRGTNGE